MIHIFAFAVALTACTVVDGDTIRCGDERIRLLGIDAPELQGHCASNRVCVDGDPIASKKSLEDLLQAGEVVIRRFGKDRYGRSLALVSVGGHDLSCHQVTSGSAVYVRKWDNNGALRAICSVGH